MNCLYYCFRFIHEGLCLVRETGIQKCLLGRGVCSSHPLTSVYRSFGSSRFRKQIGVELMIRLHVAQKKINTMPKKNMKNQYLAWNDKGNVNDSVNSCQLMNTVGFAFHNSQRSCRDQTNTFALLKIRKLFPLRYQMYCVLQINIQFIVQHFRLCYLMQKLQIFSQE